MAEKVIGFKLSIEGLAGTIETAEQLKRAIAAVNAELKKTSDVQEIKKLEKQMIDLKAAQMEVTKITREQVKARNEEITATDKTNGAYRRLSKELNDARNRYKDLAVSEKGADQEAKDLLVTINKLDAQLKGVDATVGQFQRNVGGYTQALGQFFPELGGQLGNVTGLVGDLSSGFEGISGLSGGLAKGLGGIGIAFTAFAGISEIFAGLIENAKELKNISNNISNFVKVSDSELTSLAVKSQTIAATYGKDLNEIADAANTVSKELNVSFSEALDNIELGFRKGADSNGEFLDNLREYPAQFAAAGLSIKEYLAVAIAATNQGIYSDKGLDVVKEFGLRIRGQTKTTKDALIDAFGEDFSNSIFNSLDDGSISASEALSRITDQINKTGLSGAKLQTVIADVFGSAGEDAGIKFILSLKDVIKNSNDVDKNLTKQQETSDELYKTNLRLAESQAKASLALANSSASLSLATKQVRIYFNEVIAGIFAANDEIDKAAPKLGSVASMGFNSQTLAGIESNINQRKRLAKENADKIIKEEQRVADEKKKNEDKNKKAAEDFKKAQQERLISLNTEAGLEKELSSLQDKRKTLQFGSKQFVEINKEINKVEKALEKFDGKPAGIKASKEIVAEFVKGSLAKLEEEQGKLQKAFGEAVVGSDAQKAIAVNLTAANEAIKKATDEQNEILGLNAEKKKQDAIEEINQNATLTKSFLELARSKMTLTEDELLNLEYRRSIVDQDYNDEVTRLDKLIALAKGDAKKINELQIQKNNAEAGNLKNNENFAKEEKGINDKRIANDKKFKDIIRGLDIDAIKDDKERQIARIKDKGIKDLEQFDKDVEFINITEKEKARIRKSIIDNTNQEIAKIEEDELKKLLAERQKKIELAAEGVLLLTDLFSAIQSARFKKDQEAIDEQIQATEDNIQALEAKAEKATGLKKKRLEKEIIAEKALLEQRNKQAEELQLKAAKQEKKIAIFQSIIQGAVAVTRALNTFPGPPVTIPAAIAAGVFAGIQTATIIAQPLAQGGVVTGERVSQKQNIPTRSNGDNVLAYVKRGEVVLNQRQQGLLGGSETFRRIGIKGFAEGGLVPPISAPIGVNSFNNDITGFLKTIDAKTDAINNRIDRLKAYVVSDDIARDLQEGNKLKVNATL